MLVDPAINQILDRDKAGRQSDFYQVVFAPKQSVGVTKASKGQCKVAAQLKFLTESIQVEKNITSLSSQMHLISCFFFIIEILIQLRTSSENAFQVFPSFLFSNLSQSFITVF